METKLNKAAGIAVLAAGLFVAGCATNAGAGAGSGGGTQVAKVHCYGVNSCKGHNDCKTASNSCKGHGSCRGQGFLSMTATQCSSKGGHVGP